MEVFYILCTHIAMLIDGPVLVFHPWNFSHFPFSEAHIPSSRFPLFPGRSLCAWSAAPSYPVKLSPAIISAAPEVTLPPQSPPQLRAKWFPQLPTCSDHEQLLPPPSLCVSNSSGLCNVLTTKWLQGPTCPFWCVFMHDGQAHVHKCLCFISSVGELLGSCLCSLEMTLQRITKFEVPWHGKGDLRMGSSLPSVRLAWAFMCLSQASLA